MRTSAHASEKRYDHQVISGERACAVLVAAAVGALGCVGVPSPLAPGLRGSVGVPQHGVLTIAAPLAARGEGFRRLRDDDVRWGNPRLVDAITSAALTVARARSAGPPLVVGDLSTRFGGEASGHRSHRTGRDGDLLFYVTAPDGRPLEAPGFVRIGTDGLGRVQRGSYVRLDVEREWLLVKALLESPEANVEWLFAASWIEALIIEYARARDEDPELVWYAETVLLQPGTGALAHDDHLHLRIACTPEEAVAGCEGGGPRWPWQPPLPELEAASDDELAAAILDGLVGGGASASTAR